MKTAFALLLCVISLAAAKFQKRSETWTNLAGANGASILTLYHYDNNGNRILKESRPAPDTSGATIGATKYSYDGLGRTTKVVVIDVADTVSIVQYSYGSTGNLTVISTQDKTGKVRFIDSLVYNSQGLLTQNRRITDGVLIQTHNFRYDANNRLVSDTLFEDTGAGLLPAQAVLTTYDSLGRVASEGHYRNTEGTWYLINTVMMGYASTQLISLTNYARNGVDKSLLDSVAISYDANGNRSKELGFDDERMPQYSIVYDWVNLNPGGLRHSILPERFVIEANSRGLRVSTPEPTAIVLNLRDIQGSLLRRQNFTTSSATCEIPWPASLPTGRYVAEVIIDQSHQALTVMRP